MDMSEKNREVSIQLSGVKKMYKLGQIGGGTLQGDLQSWWARVQGKEDPNTKIGTDQRLTGKTFMALNGIDLTVYKGEALGIIGANGAGKSTMLKLLSRVTAPTAGTIDIYGRIASMLEVGTGFNGEMTGRENVYMNGAILGMTKAEIDAKMEDIIEFSEVREFIDTPVKRYSSGMYVKLAFSVAAHLDSEIMIMDEVLAVGDMAFQKKCLTKMREAATQEGRTVLYVSHNMNTIRQLCDRCIVLDKGKIIFDGDVEEAIEVYMGYSNLDMTNTIKVIDSMREISNPNVCINEIIIDNEKLIYEFGTKLNFRAVIQNKKPETSSVFLRTMIKSSNGSVVTMCPTEERIYIPKFSEVSKHYCLNISNLVPGVYLLSFVIYEIGEYGANKNLDVLRDIVHITVKPSDGFNNNVVWNSIWWGNVANGCLEEIEDE